MPSHREERPDQRTAIMTIGVLVPDVSRHHITFAFCQSCKVNTMKAFLLACAAAIVIAALCMAALNKVQQPVEEAFATSGVRL